MNQKKIVLYSKDWCSYSWRAKRLLKRKGYYFEVIDATGNYELRAWLAEVTGRQTVPQILSAVGHEVATMTSRRSTVLESWNS